MEKLIFFILIIIAIIFTGCEKEEEITLTLKFEGTVCDTLGIPISNAELRLFTCCFPTLDYEFATTNNNGYYTITHEGCTDEFYTYLEAKAPGFFPNYETVQHCTNDVQKVNFELEAAFNCGDTLIDDRDGKKYATVQIGDQCWMAKNLNIGNRIAGVDDQTNNGVIEKYCYDDNEVNCKIYGGLYQWDEMIQYTEITTYPQGICPKGWYILHNHMAEWDALFKYLGGYDVAGGKMKESGTVHWNPPNTGATNQSGFTALPGGWRYYMDGSFADLDLRASFWSSTSTSSNMNGRMYLITYDSEEVFSHVYDKKNGLSIRCVTPLPPNK